MFIQTVMEKATANLLYYLAIIFSNYFNNVNHFFNSKYIQYSVEK